MPARAWRADVAFSAAALLLALLAAWSSLDFPAVAARFPGIVAIVTAAAVALHLVRLWRVRPLGAVAAAPAAWDPAAAATWLSIAALPALIYAVGFAPASVGFTAVYLWAMAGVRVRTASAAAASVAIFMYFVMLRLFNVPLPRGTFFE